MRHVKIILFFIIIWGLAGVKNVHAQFPEGPGEFNPPYPLVMSQPMDDLPEGYFTIIVGDETFYYFDGMFYQKVIREQKYLPVPPPIGAVVVSIPQGYQMMLIDGESFYNYKGIFYKRVLEGFKVIYPPV